MQKSNYFISIILISLMNFSCEEKSRSNPFDTGTDLDPSEWAPSNLHAQVLNDSQIKLTWEQEITQIEGFRIERQENGGNWIQIGEVALNTFEFTDSVSSTTDNQYIYRVYAFTSSNQSEYSDSAGINFIITDVDGNDYRIIIIGDQCWMAENLKVTHFRNGEPIPNITDNYEWENTLSHAYCAYNNNEDNSETYGRLYNFSAVVDGRILSPDGWHIPSDAEWQVLIDYLGGSNVAGGKMKVVGTTFWESPNAGATNESGFSALGGGYRYFFDASFFYKGKNENFWSSTPLDGFVSAYTRDLHFNSAEISRSDYELYGGFSVRCVRG